MNTNKKIRLQVPEINQDDIDEVTKVLRSGYLVEGSRVLSLESDICAFTRSPFAVAFSSGTATLHAALISLGIEKGDEVIIPAFSHIATANVVELTGAKPIFVDIAPRTFNIDCEKIRSKINNRTKAIMPVHEFGLACEIEELQAIAEMYEIPIIEDAACALGATYNGRHVGTFGIFGSFSFHPRKAITSGEGGILVTNNRETAESVNQLKNHGYSRVKKKFVQAGFNYRMTDFQAALLSNQIKRLTIAIHFKRELVNIYKEELAKEISIPIEPQGAYHTYQTYHVLLPKQVDRDLIIHKMKGAGIETNFGAHCIPDIEYYKKKYDLHSGKEFPHARRAYTSGLALPLYPSLKKEEIYLIARELNNLVQ